MKISDTVLAHLSVAECHENTVRLVEQLDRKTYLAVNTVLEACGGKWNKRAKVHVFAAEAQPLLDTVIAAGEVRTAREDDWFPTPPEIADLIVERARVVQNSIVLEPSAGEGAIVEAIKERGPRNALVDCIEKDEKRWTTLMAKQANRGWPRTNVFCGDFMAQEVTEPEYTQVCMNPPFSRGQECAHVTKAFSMLQRGGRLVSVMSAGITFRRDQKYATLWSQINECGHIEHLPDDAFKASGTSVRTVLVVMNKR